MANGFPRYLQTSNVGTSYGLRGEVSPEVALEAQRLNRRQQMANLLIQQGMRPLEGRMAGRFYVPPSWAEGLGRLAQVGAGVYGTRQTDRALSDLGQRNRERVTGALQDYITATQPTTVPRVPGEAESIQFSKAPAARTDEEIRTYLDRGGDPQTLGRALQSEQQAGEAPVSPPFAAPPPVVPQPAIPAQQVPKSPAEQRSAIINTLMASRDPMLMAVGTSELGRVAGQEQMAGQQAFTAEQNRLDRENRLAIAEGRLDQMVALKLLTAEQAQKWRKSLQDERLQLQKENQEENRKLREQLARESRESRESQAEQNRALRQDMQRQAQQEKERVRLEKIELERRADAGALRSHRSNLQRLRSEAEKLLNHPGLDNITGFIGGQTPNLTGDARNAQAILDTLKSQVAFGVLQEMRATSKTGGALGNVSDAEGRRLEANLAALDQRQTTEQFKEGLRQILQYVDTADSNMQGAFDDKYAPRIKSDADYEALPSGTVFFDPDGKKRRKP